MTPGCGSSEPGRASPRHGGRSPGHSRAARSSRPAPLLTAEGHLGGLAGPPGRTAGSRPGSRHRRGGGREQFGPAHADARSPPPGPAGGGAQAAVRPRPPQRESSRGVPAPAPPLPGGRSPGRPLPGGARYGGPGAPSSRAGSGEGNSDPGLRAPSPGPRAGLAPDEAIPARPASEPRSSSCTPTGSGHAVRAAFCACAPRLGPVSRARTAAGSRTAARARGSVNAQAKAAPGGGVGACALSPPGGQRWNHRSGSGGLRCGRCGPPS